jgi:hypothetical protein
MTNSDALESDSLSYDELLQQNLALRHEVEELRALEPFVWHLFADTGRKLQIYTASIKAAVSSLLNYDIFWDTTNQHEFLETIDSSVNQVSDLIVLLTLAFRAQANSLELRRDSQLLQEILSVSQMIATKKFPDIKLEISFPPTGKPVLVDYEYLTKALVLLYEVLYAQAPTETIHVIASETSGGWFLEFTGLKLQILRLIEQMHYCKTPPSSNELLSAENILRLHIICEILHLQQISIDVIDDERLPVLRFRIPDIANI